MRTPVWCVAATLKSRALYSQCVRLCTKEEHDSSSDHLESVGAEDELQKLTHVVEIQDIAWCERGCTAQTGASFVDRAVGTATGSEAHVAGTAGSGKWL